MNLEQIVRPFQDRDVTPPKRVLGMRKEVGPSDVDFGKGGSKIFLYSTWATTEAGTINDYREVSRDTKTKRVENPDDPSQYIDIKVTEKLYTRSETDPSRKLNITFNNSD